MIGDGAADASGTSFGERMRAILVGGCHECPHFTLLGMKAPWCKKEIKDVEPIDIKGSPDWCPLPLISQRTATTIRKISESG